MVSLLAKVFRKALNTCLGSQVAADEDGAEMSPGIREQILGSKS